MIPEVFTVFEVTTALVETGNARLLLAFVEALALSSRGGGALFSCTNTGGGKMGSPTTLFPVPDGPPPPVTIVWSRDSDGSALL